MALITVDAFTAKYKIRESEVIWLVVQLQGALALSNNLAGQLHEMLDERLDEEKIIERVKQADGTEDGCPECQSTRLSARSYSSIEPHEEQHEGNFWLCQCGARFAVEDAVQVPTSAARDIAAELIEECAMITPDTMDPLDEDPNGY